MIACMSKSAGITFVVPGQTIVPPSSTTPAASIRPAYCWAKGVPAPLVVLTLETVNQNWPLFRSGDVTRSAIEECERGTRGARGNNETQKIVSTQRGNIKREPDTPAHSVESDVVGVVVGEVHNYGPLYRLYGCNKCT